MDSDRAQAAMLSTTFSASAVEAEHEIVGSVTDDARTVLDPEIPSTLGDRSEDWIRDQKRLILNSDAWKSMTGEHALTQEAAMKGPMVITAPDPPEAKGTMSEAQIVVDRKDRNMIMHHMFDEWVEDGCPGAREWVPEDLRQDSGVRAASPSPPGSPTVDEEALMGGAGRASQQRRRSPWGHAPGTFDCGDVSESFGDTEDDARELEETEISSIGRVEDVGLSTQLPNAQERWRYVQTPAKVAQDVGEDLVTEREVHELYGQYEDIAESQEALQTLLEERRAAQQAESQKIPESLNPAAQNRESDSQSVVEEASQPRVRQTGSYLEPWHYDAHRAQLLQIVSEQEVQDIFNSANDAAEALEGLRRLLALRKSGSGRTQASHTAQVAPAEAGLPSADVQELRGRGIRVSRKDRGAHRLASVTGNELEAAKKVFAAGEAAPKSTLDVGKSKAKDKERASSPSPSDTVTPASVRKPGVTQAQREEAAERYYEHATFGGLHPETALSIMEEYFSGERDHEVAATIAEANKAAEDAARRVQEEVDREYALVVQQEQLDEVEELMEKIQKGNRRYKDQDAAWRKSSNWRAGMMQHSESSEERAATADFSDPLAQLEKEAVKDEYERKRKQRPHCVGLPPWENLRKGSGVWDREFMYASPEDFAAGIPVRRLDKRPGLNRSTGNDSDSALSESKTNRQLKRLRSKANKMRREKQPLTGLTSAGTDRSGDGEFKRVFMGPSRAVPQSGRTSGNEADTEDDRRHASAKFRQGLVRSMQTAGERSLAVNAVSEEDESSSEEAAEASESQMIRSYFAERKLQEDIDVELAVANSLADLPAHDVRPLLAETVKTAKDAKDINKKLDAQVQEQDKQIKTLEAELADLRQEASTSDPQAQEEAQSVLQNTQSLAPAAGDDESGSTGLSSSSVANSTSQAHEEADAQTARQADTEDSDQAIVESGEGAVGVNSHCRAS